MWKFVLFFLVFNTLGRLPLPVMYRIAGLAGDICYYVFAPVRRNVIDNLKHVMPPDTPQREVARAARRIFRNVTLYYADLAYMPRMNINDFFNRRLRFQGVEEHLRPAIDNGKGVVMLSAHYGNPELAVQGLAAVDIKVFALTEPQYPRLSRMLDRIRSSKGHAFGPVKVGNVKRVIQTLRGGGVVALMGDRDIQGPKEVLSFCGEETLMPTGPIEVALRTGATVIPAFSARRDTYAIEAILEEPLGLERTGDLQQDVKAGTLRYIERLERRLRADPPQWAVLESIWDTPVAVEKSTVAAGSRR